MKLKRYILLILSVFMLMSGGVLPSFAEDEALVYHVDSINGTRWDNYLCVYRGLEHTGQNEWGENIVVNSDGIVTEKIPGADIKGKNLAIPEGGMVVSGAGDIGKEVYAAVEIGDKCLFDEYSMRVYFSKGDIDPFYTQSLRVTGYNDVRWADTVIIYDQSGKNTDTNVYGYEVCVDAEGYVVSAGGNNNIVPEGGYVISATETKDTDILKMYFAVGTKCRLEKNQVIAKYSQSELKRTAENEFEILKAKLEAAKSQYKLIDYQAVEAAIAQIEIGEIKTLEERNAVIAKMRAILPMLVESRTVETRSVWYTPVETTAKAIKQTVAEMKEAGINELVLSSNTFKGSLVPFDTDVIPFKRDAIVRRLDVIQTYIDECRANGISIVVLIPVMGGSFGEHNKEWFDVTNTGEERDEIFFSPANAEYRKAFMDYIRFIITNYDIDGLQLDYIRYPQFYDGVDAGYDQATIKLFEEKTGYGEDVVKAIGKQLYAHPQWNVWWNFKTELINGWVKEVYGIATELRPDIYVSAAVAGSDGIGSYCQDPFTWVKDGYIDGIYVMSYAEEINEISARPHLNARSDKSYLVMGCGAYLSISNESVIGQTDNSIVLGADGTGYFEWEAVRNHRYTDIFKASLFKNDAIPVTADLGEVVDRLVATAKARVEFYCETADEAVASELRGIMAKLPEKGADKATLTSAVEEINGKLDGNDARILTADLDLALRAINMDKPKYEFVKPSDDDESSESVESESISEESVSDELQESSFPIIPVAIGGGVVVIIAVLFAIIKKKK